MRNLLLSIAALLAGINTAAAVDANTVEVFYSGTTATVTVASNISSYVTVNSGSSSHVSLVQSPTWSGNASGEITYVLSGASDDGEFYIEGAYKMSIDLNGLTLNNPTGPAINIQNGKRIKVSAKSGTENTLSDGINEDYNGCIHCKGHTEFKGNGVLNVTGNSRHGVYSKEYMQVKNLTLNIAGAVKDGIHCKEYFLMESGTVSISNVLDDGIQVELAGLTSTGVKTDHEDEDTGNFYMLDGTLTVKNYGGEPVKADGEIKYSGGTHTFVVDDAIEAARMVDDDTTRQIFDLNGRLMPSNSPLTKGLYIEKDGGRTVKRIVR